VREEESNKEGKKGRKYEHKREKRSVGSIKE
jgi:hypothetical protein